MKHSIIIKKLLTVSALALAAGLPQTLRAFTYNDTDLLLVFRKDNFNDVEFNLGNVSNYLGQVNGTVTTVTNWSLAQVKANFNNSLANVKFLVVASASTTNPLPRVWLTDANGTGTPTLVSGSKLSGLYSKISFVGSQAVANTATNAQESYVAAPSDVSSYSYIASQGGTLDASTIGGAAPFPVESENPATNRLVELRASNVTPKPPATIVGTFGLTSAGVLTFTAGPPQAPLTPSHIQSVARVGSQNSVTFTTLSGTNYRLRYSPTLVPGISSWTAMPTVVAGDGSNKTLTDTTSDSQRFYSVEASR